MRLRALTILLSAGLTTIATARAAEAQWFLAGVLGTNFTQPATVSVRIPAAALDIQFHDVKFDGRPFESPQYYGVRVGRWFGRGRLGVDFELIHLKVISRTAAAYATSGTVGGAAVPPGQPMAALVERYSMTHGLNFLLVNVSVRHAVPGGRATVYLRGGAGPTRPHTETTVLGGAVDQYEFGGLGAQAAGGISVKLAGRVSFVGEYKFTYARPTITVAGGTGQTTAATHHLTAGLAFGLGR